MGTLTAQAVTVKVCVSVIVEVTEPLSPPGAGVVAGPAGIDPEPEEPSVGAGLPETETPPEPAPMEDGIPLGEPGAPDVGTPVGKPEVGRPEGKPGRLEGRPEGNPGMLSVGTPLAEPRPPEVGAPLLAGPEDADALLEAPELGVGRPV